MHRIYDLTFYFSWEFFNIESIRCKKTESMFVVVLIKDFLTFLHQKILNLFFFCYINLEISSLLALAFAFLQNSTSFLIPAG